MRFSKSTGFAVFLFLLITLQPSWGFSGYNGRFDRFRRGALSRRILPGEVTAGEDTKRKKFAELLPLQSKISPEETDGPLGLSASIQDDDMFDMKTTLSLVAGQSALVGVGAAAGALAGTPNFGFGPAIDFGATAVLYGSFTSLPLGVLAVALDSIEEKFPALQDVTKATQRSVLALLGGTFKPGIGLLVAGFLGVAAGFGEELIFRGVLQYELSNRVGEFAALGVTSIIFGLLHAVTPLYAFLATLASLYFGYLYSASGNLAVPIACHAFYGTCGTGACLCHYFGS